MHWIQSIVGWMAGGVTTPYHNLRMCMNDDVLWISITVFLDVAVAAGYAVIAYHWFINQRVLPPSPARSALATMRNIFAFCGFCGYLFIPIKLFWPAWRLYDMFMVVLVFYTWRYALNSKNLKVVYSAIGRSNKLAEDLALSREESKQKSFFLNAISHDLRTPLNGIMLNANLGEIHVQANDLAAAQKTIIDIKAGARLTADLLDRLLEYGRLDSEGDKLQRSEFDLEDLIRDVLNSHAALAAKKSLVLTSRAVGHLVLFADRLKLERILNNLLSNAIKFTNSGSVRLEVATSQKDVEIHVIDTGIGIAPEYVSRLFEEFFQVENHERDRQKGFGLGLAISRRLIQQIGGDLQVDSSPGKGSRFSVILPNVIGTANKSVGDGQLAFSTQSVAQPTASPAGGG